MQQDAVEACTRKLNVAVARMARGHKIDAELVEAIAELSKAVSMLIIEPVHQRLEASIDAEHEVIPDA